MTIEPLPKREYYESERKYQEAQKEWNKFFKRTMKQTKNGGDKQLKVSFTISGKFSVFGWGLGLKSVKKNYYYII